MEKTRRAFLGAVGGACATALAGCTGEVANPGATVGSTSPAPRNSYSTTAETVAVKGQPTVADGVPAAWGAIAHTPTELEKLVEWDVLINSPHGPADAPEELEGFDVAGQVVLITVGVLPTGDALVGSTEDASDVHFEGDTVRNDVTSYRAFEPDSNAPEHHYDYTISLWDLNGAREPDSIEVDYHE